MAERSMAINPSLSGGRSSRRWVVLQKFRSWKMSSFHVDCAPRARSRCSIHRYSHLPAATYGRARGEQAFRTAYSSFSITPASHRIGSITGITARRKGRGSAMHCCYPDAQSREGPTMCFFSLHQERSGTELFDELLRSRRRHERVSFYFIFHYASHRADADKVISHHLSWNGEKENQMDELFRQAEPNAGLTPPNPQSDT